MNNRNILRRTYVVGIKEKNCLEVTLEKLGKKPIVGGWLNLRIIKTNWLKQDF